MEENDRKTPIKLKAGIPTLYVQIIAFVFLVIMFVLDKIMHIIIPPLGNTWYLSVASIAFFGATVAEKLINKFK